jgi:hypothetical protein
VRFEGLLADVRLAIAACDAGFVLSYAVETILIACRDMMAVGKPAAGEALCRPARELRALRRRLDRAAAGPRCDRRHNPHDD